MTGSDPVFYDEEVAAEADAVINRAIASFVSEETNVDDMHFAAVVWAPAGAGKSRLVTSATDAACTAHSGNATIAVGTPTNDQAYELVEAIATRYPGRVVAFVPATKRTLPPMTLARPNVAQIRAQDADQFPVVVGTLDKLGDAASRGDLPRFRHLCIDEAFQGDAGKYFLVGELADRHLLVGDPGQLDPFTTMDDPGRWRGLAEDPTQTAVQVLTRNHVDTNQDQLPITRRLPPSAVPVVSSFYPGHPFRSWTLPGVRRMQLVPGAGVGRTARLDAALDRAASEGWAWLRLPDTPVLTADPATIDLMIDLVWRLGERSPELASERTGGSWTPFDPGRLAIAVSHNDQKDYLRSAFDSAGLTAVRIDTANKLQGLEFDVVVAWHPLAGLPVPDGFHLDPGRLCVMLTRHRHGCIVVGRAGDPDLVDQLPPTSEVWLGHDPDPILDGWFAHSLVFDRLAPVAVDL